MPKIAHKYLAFSSVNFLKVCTVEGKIYTFPISFFKFCLMLTNVKYSDTDKSIGPILNLFCIKMFLEAIPTRVQSLKKFHPSTNSENCREALELVVAMETVNNNKLNSIIKRTRLQCFRKLKIAKK